MAKITSQTTDTGNSLASHEAKVVALHRRISERKDDNVTWIEAVAEYCTVNNTDVEDIVPLLSPFIIARIKDEAISKNLVKHEKKVDRVSIEFE